MVPLEFATSAVTNPPLIPSLRMSSAIHIFLDYARHLPVSRISFHPLSIDLPASHHYKPSASSLGHQRRQSKIRLSSAQRRHEEQLPQRESPRMVSKMDLQDSRRHDTISDFILVNARSASHRSRWQ
jgi:hypothetical protein